MNQDDETPKKVYLNSIKLNLLPSIPVNTSVHDTTYVPENLERDKLVNELIDAAKGVLVSYTTSELTHQLSQQMREMHSKLKALEAE